MALIPAGIRSKTVVIGAIPAAIAAIAAGIVAMRAAVAAMRARIVTRPGTQPLCELT